MDGGRVVHASGHSAESAAALPAPVLRVGHAADLILPRHGADHPPRHRRLLGFAGALHEWLWGAIACWFLHRAGQFHLRSLREDDALLPAQVSRGGEVPCQRQLLHEPSHQPVHGNSPPAASPVPGRCADGGLQREQTLLIGPRKRAEDARWCAQIWLVDTWPAAPFSALWFVTQFLAVASVAQCIYDWYWNTRMVKAYARYRESTRKFDAKRKPKAS
eukprot:scaffold600_cov385-Prasinococcus_capsulatus_cf.AAC.19